MDTKPTDLYLNFNIAPKRFEWCPTFGGFFSKLMDTDGRK